MCINSGQIKWVLTKSHTIQLVGPTCLLGAYMCSKLMILIYFKRLIWIPTKAMKINKLFLPTC